MNKSQGRFLFATLLLFATVGCSSENSFSGKSFTNAEKIQALIDLASNSEPQINFNLSSNPTIEIKQVNAMLSLWSKRDALGFCSDTPDFEFEVQVNSKTPMMPFAEWAIVNSYDNSLYGDTIWMTEVQPNDINYYGIGSPNKIEIPEMSCKEFNPVAIMFTATDKDYYWEYFYTIKKKTYSDKENESWDEYVIDSGPYRVEDSGIDGRYFDF